MCFNFELSEPFVHNVLLNQSGKCYATSSTNSLDVNIDTVTLGLWMFSTLLTCLLLGKVDTDCIVHSEKLL